ncbi:MAG: hypothetical protein QGH94_04970 [Phycisphaerae bacterium]|nr:hypothetical protein [Phycisphaerae bacterium]
MNRKTSNKNEPDIFIKPGFGANFRLLFGCPRRSLENRFRRQWVRSNIDRRIGQCQRCGACCRMGFRCSSLKYDIDGRALCEIYDRRTNASCRDFPMSPRDLAERDKVCSQPCGFSFIDADETK